MLDWLRLSNFHVDWRIDEGNQGLLCPHISYGKLFVVKELFHMVAVAI
jgi:hypothetical protein